MQLLDPKAIGLSLAPFFEKSKRQMPVEASVFIALIDSLSSAGFIKIQPISLLLQSVLKNVERVVSNYAKTGEEVIQDLRSANNSISSGVQDNWGIGFL